MNLLLATLVVVAFAGIVSTTRLTTHVREVVRVTRGSLAIVSDDSLSDAQKERRLREDTPRVFRLFGRIVLASTSALGLPLAALWAADRTGIASLSGVLGVLMRLDFLLAVSVLAVAGLWLARRTG